MGDLESLAAEAYVYGYPLVADVEKIGELLVRGMGSTPPAGRFNVFAHSRSLAGPDDRFVTINNDTVYSMAQIDLSGGPVRLDVPEAGERYYVLQFIDAWTNNFAYVGTRATGGGRGSFWLVPPGDGRPAPAGTTLIRFPTTVASILGRWACAGPRDLPTVAALQAQLTLTQAAGGSGLPRPARVDDDLQFFENMRVWMAAFPPSPADQVRQQRFAPLGLLQQGASPYASAAPELAAALRAGLAAGKQRIEDAALHGDRPVQHGWQLGYHGFDYNTEYFEVGTVDDPQWKMADPQTVPLARAVAARTGLWGNHGYEAAYAVTWVDSHGAPLSGTRAYTLRFTQPPPVRAFWSVTMYDVPDYYLVANPIGRYSIGDRTPGLEYAPDGSLTIVLQHDQPAEAANWLPAPAAGFRPVLRMYLPDPDILDGTYQLPPITPS